MPNTLLFVHDWGLSSDYWWPLLEKMATSSSGITDTWEPVAMDLGFLGEEKLPAFEPEDTVVIGHSYGFLWSLLRRMPWKAMISLGGFSCFTQWEDNPKGISSDTIASLQKLLDKNPRQAVSKVWQWSDIPPETFENDNIGEVEAKWLRRALNGLATVDARPMLDSITCPVMNLHGGLDKVVPVGMAAEQFEKHQHYVHPRASHSIGFKEADWCLAHMIPFLQKL